MDISNRTLGLLLVAAIVVSIGGTFISLNSLNDLGGAPTGFATTDTGNVTLTVSNVVSIIVNDSSIDFGACTMVINATKTSSDYYSNSSDGYADIAECSNHASFPDNISVQNIGNTNATVTVQSNIGATTLFGDSSATMKYIGITDPAQPGCGTEVTTWTELTTSPTTVCSDFNFVDGSDQFLFDVYVHLTQNSKSGGTADITFTAS